MAMDGWRNSIRVRFFNLLVLAAVVAMLFIVYMQGDDSQAFAHYTSKPRGLGTDLNSEGRALPADHVTGEQFSVRYLLSMAYAEQLSSAMKNYMQLVNIAAEWGMKSVEPLISESRLYGTQCLYRSNTNESFYHYSRFLNITQVDKLLSECLVGPSASLITGRTSFLHRSYRDIVVVYLVHHKPLPRASSCGDIHSNKPYLQEFVKRENGMIDCTEVAAREGMKTAVEHTLNKELDRNEMSGIRAFNVSRVICVDTTEAISLIALKEVILSSGDRRGRESVLFVTWKGKRRGESFVGGLNYSRCSLLSMQHTAEVSDTASMFIDSLGLKRPFLSIHIRSEKIIQSDFYHPGYMTCCLSRLHSLVDKIMKRHDLKDVLLIRDYGKYGTDACSSTSFNKTYSYCRNMSDHMMKEIGEWGIRYGAFDPVKFRAVDNSGFASMVEFVALSKGNILLTVGCGRFQLLLKDKYAQQNQPSYAYSICPCYRDPEVLHGLLRDNSCESQIP